MHSRTSLLVLVSFVMAAASICVADEGMWPLYSVDQLPLGFLQSRGLKLQPQQIYNNAGSGIASAIVQVGGATGSFVSADGLILTNHHVAFDAVQEQSTVEHNYVRDGFYALTRDKEIPAIGYRAYVTLSSRDITEQILKGISDKSTDLERYKTIDKNIKGAVRDNEKGGETKARVAAMFGGKQYILYTTLEIRDVRMVYVPPDAVGDFGGDIDNWMWPRHAGDFAFLRAYIGPDGHPADFASANVPYQPKVYLPVATNGVREGDFTMTIGFPGNTARHISSYEMTDRMNFSLPASIATAEDAIGILTHAGEQDSVVKLRLESSMKGINNILKKNYAIMDGFKKGNTLEEKRTLEKGLVEFLAKDKALQAKYGKVLPSLDSLYASRKPHQARDFLFGTMMRYCEYLRLATTVYRWACEREKPDPNRERGFQDRDTLIAKERLKNAQINLVPESDKELMKYFLGRVVKLPDAQKIAPIVKLVGDRTDKKAAIAEIVGQLYAGTKVGDADERMAMFAMKKEQLEKLNDPFINLARELKPDADTMRERDKAFSGAETRLTPLLIQAFVEWKQAKIYPDANGTMRLSYGEVKRYSPRDATDYFWLTGLHGVIEKETNKDPFTVPDSVRAAFEQQDFGPWVDPTISDIPVDFLTTNDITNGNSGSPVINGEGKLIGAAFDGNWEGVASDYIFTPAVTRTIAVDIRYVMFIIDRVYHLEPLVRELNLTPTGKAFHHLQ